MKTISRARVFPCLLLVLAATVTELQPCLKAAAEQPETPVSRLWLYLGTYTKTVDAGINFCQLDLSCGSLTQPVVVAKVANPSFLARNPRLPLLYAISEVANFGEKQGGFISAYRISPKSGRLELLNRQSTGGSYTCYVSVDHSGQSALVANYGGGSVASLPILADGTLAPAVTIDQHYGSSVNPSRQTGPFAHCIDPDPANRFALSADLGTDKVLIYRLRAAEGTLGANDPAFVSLPPGSGPRHLAFHPNGRFVYVVNELKCTVTVFRYDAERGNPESVQTVSTLPEGFTGQNTAAEIQVHPSGRFLYSSNRGHDSLAIFAVDAATGWLRILAHQPTQGKAPRHFALDLRGLYLLAANQDSDNVVVFRVNPESGLLQPTGNSIKVPAPVCVLLMRPSE